MCPKTFTTNSSLEKHIANLHAVIPTYGCPECSCTCKDQSTLNRHRAMDHGVGKGALFVCPQCEKTFTRKYHLDRHLQQTGCNGTPRLSLPCEVRVKCKIVFFFYIMFVRVCIVFEVKLQMQI